MGVQLVFSGPSTAGKTSLMLGLAETSDCDQDFRVDKTWTTRPIRPNENDRENIFVNTEEFDANRSNFLTTFANAHATYEYGIGLQEPVDNNEVRMRILTPAMAIKFRGLVQDPTLICSITPFHNDPESVFRNRDPSMAEDDIQDRLSRFQQDIDNAQAIADVKFQNVRGLMVATCSLRDVLVEYL